MRRFLCLLLALVQVLPSLGAVAPRHSDSRPQYGPVGMSYGVVTSENHDYLVDTSQPYAEVIQEKTWLTDGAGKPLDGNALIYRYDIGLDRLHYFKYQMPINGPPSLGSPVLSEWLLFDGLGSTRMLVGDSGSVVDEFGYNDAFGIPYRVVAGGGRAVAPPGFFLNGQQWDGGSGWGGSIWSGSPAFNSGEGLYFNRARYYQPGLGRFVGEDPELGDETYPEKLHKYRFSSNNPVNIIDPSGRVDTLPGFMATMSIIARLSVVAGGAYTFLFNDYSAANAPAIGEKGINYDPVGEALSYASGEILGGIFGIGLQVAAPIIWRNILRFSPKWKSVTNELRDVCIKFWETRAGQPNSSVKPMVTTVKDMRTGKKFTAINKKRMTPDEFDSFKAGLHPLMKERVDAYNDYFSHIVAQNLKDFDLPGSHGDVIAVDMALKAREALGMNVSELDLTEFAMYCLNVESPNKGLRAWPMCQNCFWLSHGVKGLTEDIPVGNNWMYPVNR